MNPLRHRLRLLLVPAAAVLLSVSLPHLRASDAAPANAPLRLQIDPKPINRAAPDPISFAPVVEKTAASVVFVYSTKQVRGQDMSPFMNDPLLRRFFGLPGQGGRVPPQTEHGLGSGVVISRDGYILTNNHVIEGADDVKVSIGESARRYDATVVGSDRLSDVAVLKIKADGLVPAVLGDSDQLKIGDIVMAIGDPFGIGQSVSRGIVSAVGRGNLGIEAVEDFIQTDAAINPGNSGGAMIDAEGRVVGLNTAILSRSGGFAGVGFAIPINMVRNVAEQIVNTGRVERGFLGVQPQELTPALAEQFGTYSGALVAEVTPGSPADKAGLQAGDIITQIDGHKIRDAGHLLFTISQLAPGSRVGIDFLRNNNRKTATATLARRPQQTLAENDGEENSARRKTNTGVLNGVYVADLTPQLRDQLQVPNRIKGAVVTELEPTSAAALQGLRPGDVIVELDRKAVRNADDCARLSNQIKGPTVMARIWRAGQTLYVVIDESRQ
jgi:serine protease Do